MLVNAIPNLQKKKKRSAAHWLIWACWPENMAGIVRIMLMLEDWLAVSYKIKWNADIDVYTLSVSACIFMCVTPDKQSKWESTGECGSC